MITRFATEPSQGYLDHVKRRVLEVVKKQPGVPFSVYLLSELLGVLPECIESAFAECEEPAGPQPRPGAYMHCSRISKQIIYIPDSPSKRPE